MIIQNSAANTLPELLQRFGVSMKVILHEIPDGSEMGTADAIRTLGDKITTDFIVISSDLVTDFKMGPLIDRHRVHSASVTCLLVQPEPLNDAERLAALNAKNKGHDEGLADFIGLDPVSDRLMMLANQADAEDEHLAVRVAMLRQYPQMDVHCNLLDAHLYVFAKWVVDYIAANKKISSLKGDLLPRLINAQYLKQGEKVPAPHQFTSDVFLSSMEHKTGTDTVRCYGYTEKHGDLGICTRANTVKLYGEANRLSAGHVSALISPDIVLIDRSNISSKSQVGADSMVGKDSKVGARSAIKRTIIGSHCTLGDRVKISNSVVLDHVTVGDDCVINNSVVCENVYVSASCNLTNCQVGGSYTVPEGTVAKNEIVEGEFFDEKD